MHIRFAGDGYADSLDREFRFELLVCLAQLVELAIRFGHVCAMRFASMRCGNLSKDKSAAVRQIKFKNRFWCARRQSTNLCVDLWSKRAAKHSTP